MYIYDIEIVVKLKMVPFMQVRSFPFHYSAGDTMVSPFKLFRIGIHELVKGAIRLYNLAIDYGINGQYH